MLASTAYIRLERLTLADHGDVPFVEVRQDMATSGFTENRLGAGTTTRVLVSWSSLFGYFNVVEGQKS